MMNAMMDRILGRLGDRELPEKLASMPNSDFNSLLLKIYQMRAGNTAPVDVVKAFGTNRFSVPSAIDPADYHALETELLSLARQIGINGVLLSPAAPLASCSAFGCVDQNNVVSAVRGTEILSDPTNMLAILIADKRRNKEEDGGSLHYCTTARVLRAQVFPDSPRHFSHFGIFCIVSAGRDGGSYSCEKDLMLKHLSYYKKLLLEKYRAQLTVTLRKRGGYTDGGGFFDGMASLIKDELPDVPVSFDLEHEGNRYYQGLNFKLYMERESGSIEIGDGGYVDWVQRMTGNRKERCLISGIGIDRLLLPL